MTSSLDGVPSLPTLLGNDRVARRLLTFLPLVDRGRLAAVDRRCYKVVTGRRFVHIVGEHDTYALVRGLRHEDVAQILDQTGFQIPWPAGRSWLPVATQQGESNAYCFGEGSFGVFCAGVALGDRRFVGLKITEGSAAVEAEAAVQRELTGMPNLMGLIDCCRSADSSGQVTLFQVMEFAGLGNVADMRDAIHALEDQAFRDQIVFYLAQGLFRGLEGMHGKDFSHLDIKLPNLLVDHRGEVRVGDYGCSKRGPVSGLYSQGDWTHFSPERWLSSYSDPGSDQLDGRAADAWAAGVALLELLKPGHDRFNSRLLEQMFTVPVAMAAELAGLPPCSSRAELIRSYFQRELGKIAELEGAESDSFWGVVKSLLALKPSDRPSMEEVLRHPWCARMEAESAPHREAVLARLRELVQEQKGRAPRGRYVRGAALSPMAKSTLSTPRDLPLPHFANYVRRRELEGEVREKLLGGQPLLPIAGAPGMGKSQLVTYLLHDPEVSSQFGLMLWFRDADQASSVERQYIALAQELGLADKRTSFEDAFASVCHYLAKLDSRFLVVFDNADEPDSLKRYLPTGGQVVVTTRLGSWEGAISVTTLAATEGRELVHKLLQDADPEADRLCEELGNVPLALVQAAAYMRNQRLSAAAYLSLLGGETGPTSSDQRLFGRELPYSMGKMYQLTFRELERGGALPLLFRLSCLAPDAMPQPLVAELAEDPAHLQHLVDYALVRPDSASTYAIHRVAASMARETMSATERRQALLATMNVFAGHFDWRTAKNARTNEATRGFLSHGESLLRFDPLPKSLRVPRTRTLLWVIGERCAALQLDGMASQLEEGQRLAEEAWGEADPDRAWGYNVLANGWSEIGQYKRALELHSRALKIRGMALGETHFRYATSLMNVGNAHQALGQNREAAECQQRAVEILREALGKEDFLVGVALDNLGRASSGLGRYAEALERYQEGLRIRRLFFGERHPEVVLSLNGMGGALRDLGKHEEAEAAHLEALSIIEEARGKEHPETLFGLNGLAQVYTSMGRHQEARETYQRCLATAQKIYGDDHPHVAAAWNNVGIAWRDSGESQMAVECFEKACAIRDEPAFQCGLGNARLSLGDAKGAVEIFERALELLGEEGDDVHPHRAACWVGLSNAKMAQGHHKEALALRRRVVEHAEANFGVDHPRYALALNNLGNTLHVLGESEEALRVLQHSLDLKRKLLGDEHPDVAGGLLNLAIVQNGLGNEETAVQLCEEALAIHRKAFGSAHPAVAANLCNLAGYESDLGNHRRALELVEEAIAIDEKKWGDQHPTFAQDLAQMANIRHALGEYADAVKLFERALVIQRKAFGEVHSRVATSLGNQACSLEMLGNSSDALAKQREALAILEQVHEGPHSTKANCLNNIANVHMGLGRGEEALGFYQMALEMREAILGSDHPDVAQSLQNMGQALRGLGRHAEAEERFQRSLEIREKVLCSDHLAISASLQALGELRTDQGRNGEALGLFERALKLLEAKLGSEHEGVGGCLLDLGCAYFGLERYADATEANQRALAIFEEKLGPEHTKVAAALCNLGNASYGSGDGPTARDYYVRSLKIRRKQLGDQHPDVASTLTNLGVVCSTLQDFQGAKGYYSEALPLWVKLGGERHPKVAECADNLGLCCRAMGEGADAVGHFLMAVEVRRVLGDEALLARSLSRLGDAQLLTEDAASAVTSQTEALELRKRALGPENRETVQTMTDLGIALRGAEWHDEALAQLEESLAASRRIFEEQSDRVASVLDQLAKTYAVAGNLQRALETHEEALAIEKVVYGEAHFFVGQTYESIGNVLVAAGQLEGAAAAFVSAGQIFRTTVPEEQLVPFLMKQGNVSKELGRWAHAIELFEECAEIFARSQGEDDPQVALMREVIGRCRQWMAAGRTPEPGTAPPPTDERTPLVGGDQTRQKCCCTII